MVNSIRNCLNCNVAFRKVENPLAKYCSRSCYFEYRKTKGERLESIKNHTWYDSMCVQCNCLYHQKALHQRFCSKYCIHNHMLIKYANTV